MKKYFGILTLFVFSTFSCAQEAQHSSDGIKSGADQTSHDNDVKTYSTTDPSEGAQNSSRDVRSVPPSQRDVPTPGSDQSIVPEAPTELRSAYRYYKQELPLVCKGKGEIMFQRQELIDNKSILPVILSSGSSFRRPTIYWVEDTKDSQQNSDAQYKQVRFEQDGNSIKISEVLEKEVLMAGVLCFSWLDEEPDSDFPSGYVGRREHLR